MIKLDYTRDSIVVICTDCPSWCQGTDSRPAGWRLGVLHQAEQHPGQGQAAEALRKALAAAAG